MKGFTPTAKHLGKMSGHQFPPKFGFSGSTGAVKTVKPYTRSVPIKKAEGGSVDSATIKRSEPSNQLDAETGGKSPLRPGFKRGGRMRKANGGQVAAAKGGVLARGYKSKC